MSGWRFLSIWSIVSNDEILEMGSSQSADPEEEESVCKQEDENWYLVGIEVCVTFCNKWAGQNSFHRLKSEELIMTGNEQSIPLHFAQLGIMTSMDFQGEDFAHSIVPQKCYQSVI